MEGFFGYLFKKCEKTCAQHILACKDFFVDLFMIGLEVTNNYQKISK